MWKFKNDNTPAIINAKKHIASSHSNKIDKLPKTAILFFMRGGIEYTTKHYKTTIIFTPSLVARINTGSIISVTPKFLSFSAHFP